MIKYKLAIDYKDQIIMELFTSENKEHWFKVMNWFRYVKIEDKGMQYMWDSFFTDKYLQSIYMYKGMLKHINNIYKAQFIDSFQYTYTPNITNKIAQWFKTQYKLTQGTFAGLDFELEDFQCYIMSRCWGLVKKRKFLKDEEKKLGIIFPVNKIWYGATRKNGKSELFAGIGDFLIHNPFGNDARPEIYSTGPDEKASAIIWDKGKALARSTESISNLFNKTNTRAFNTYNGGQFIKLPFKKEAIEGRNPSIGIVTEYHLHPTDEVVESFETAMNLSRINSLLFFDTTKGTGIYGVAYNREQQYKEVIEEQLAKPLDVIGINIATCFWELDDSDDYDWFDNEWETNIFRKSTPALGKIISLSALQQEWLIAKRDPLKRREFLIKKGGKWIGHNQAMFEMQDINACNQKYDGVYKLEDFAKNKEECIIAVDLANTGDSNAVSLIFKDIKDGEEIPIVHSKIFIPHTTLEERVVKERKPYHDWCEKGFVESCGNKSVDHKVISDYIYQLMKKYNVKKIVFDPYQQHIIKTYLNDQGGISESWFTEVAQNAKTLSAPLEIMVNRIHRQLAYFFNNPVTTDHILGFKPDFNSTGGMYFVKTKQQQRIDIVATIVTGIAKLDLIKPIGKAREGVFLQVW